MGALGRIKRYAKKTGSLLMLPHMYYRAKHPKEMEMTLSVAEGIIEKARPAKEGSPFKAAAVSCESLFDLSVVIPVYNGEAYLRECLDSILKQETKYSFEVICVNDGSKDRSLQILDEYRSDPRIKVLSQKNQGISAARNNGLAQARGKYVMLIDNDDMLAEGTIETVMENAFRYDADMVKTGHQVFTSRRKINVIESDFHVYTDGLGAALLVYNGFVWGSAIRRSLFEKVCFPEGFWYEDMITRLLLYRLCKSFVYVDKALYRYRMHESNASKKVWSARNLKALDQYFLMDEIKKHADRLGLDENQWVCQLYLYECGGLLYSRLKDLDLETRQAAFNACSELLQNFTGKWDVSELSTAQYILMRALVCRDYSLWEQVCQCGLL